MPIYRYQSARIRHSWKRWQQRQPYNIDNPTGHAREHKGPLAEHLSTSETVYYYWNSVRDPERNNRRRKNGIECTARAEEDAPKDHIESQSQE